jgi:hypothetical protein
MQIVEFVVLETGARWPKWAAPGHAETLDRLVVAGGPGTAPTELAQRALHHVTQAAISGRQLRRVVLVVGPRQDEEIIRARRLLARAMLTHMALNGHGQLVLAAPDPLDDRGQGELMTLLGALTHRLAGTGLTVSLRIGDEQLAPEPVLASCIRLRVPSREKAVGANPS